MKYANSFLLIVLQLIESTVGSCRLRATVRTIEGNKQGNVIEPVLQTQLQLQCDNGNCPVTNFTTCDTYTDLNISPDCTGETCSEVFNLCENTCINEDQELPTGPVGPPINPMPSNSSVATELASPYTPTAVTNIPNIQVISTVTITVSTNDNTSVISQSSCIITSTILSMYTTTSIKEMPTTITTTTTTWSPCPQSITKLNVMQELSQNKSCEIFTSIKPTTTTVLSHEDVSCTPCPSQPVTPPDKTNTSTTSPALEAGPCIKPSASTPAHGASSSNATSALGALLGTSLVLLTAVTAGWVWTCWTMKKKGRFTINSKQNNFPNTPGTVTINNTTDTLRRLQNPLYEETTTNGLIPLSEAELQTGQGESEETGPTYEIIPLADPINTKVSKKNGNAQLEKEETPTAGGWVSVGVASSKNDDNIGSVGGGNVNHYYLPDEKTKGESSKRTGDRDRENNYHLLGNSEEEREEMVKENVYHVLENPLDSYDKDYADPDVGETNNIYHVLEGPTPVEKEEREKEKAEGKEEERDKVEEEEKERETFEREEQLTEPTAYEIPLASGSKQSNTIL